MSRWLPFALAAVAWPATAAQAQFGYGGYLNFDHDAGMAELQRIVAQADARAEQSLQQLMRHPEVKARYEAYRRAGGTASLREYAQGYARTGGYTAAGTRNYLDRERQRNSQWREHQAELNAANDEARRSRQHGMESAMQRNKELGDVIAGQRHYVDAEGNRFLLPYTRPGYLQDSTGRLYHLDQWGNYQMRTPQGYWVPLQQR